MKQKLVITGGVLLIFAAIVTAMVVEALRFPSATYGWEECEAGVREVIHEQGVIVQREGAGRASEVALPWKVWLTDVLRERENNPGRIHFATGGFPNSSVQWGFGRAGGPQFDCIVRYVDSRASVIEVRSGTATWSQAQELTERLGRRFPGLPVRLVSE